MTTIIQEAFKAAGLQPLKVPANKRVWLWLRDHPEKTYKEVAAAIGMTTQQASNAIADLKVRNMLTIVGDISKGSRRGGSGYGDKKIQRFSCKYKEWELLPMAAAKKPKGSAPSPAFTASPPGITYPRPTPAPLTLIQQAHAKCLKETGIDATEVQIIAMALRKYLGETK